MVTFLIRLDGEFVTYGRNQTCLGTKACSVWPTCSDMDTLTSVTWSVSFPPSVEVNSHTVNWGEEVRFSCKLYASANTAELEPCICKVSVRKVSMKSM